MFKDRDEALKQMAQALLEEESEDALSHREEDFGEDYEDYEDYDEDYYEDLDEDFGEDGAFLSPAEDFHAYNTDPFEEDLASYAQDLYRPQKRSGITGLALTCIGLMAAILAVLVYWVVKLRG